MDTPLFDTVQAEHDVPVLPIPAHPTHEEFLAERGYYDWVAGLDQYERPEPAKHISPEREANPTGSLTGTMRPVPTKRNKR